MLRELEEEEGARLQRLLDRILKNNRIVDTESLCIVPGEQVWSIRVDVHVLDHDGNLIDAVSAAALASLIDYRRPDVTISEEGVKVVRPSSPSQFTPHSTALLRRTPFHWPCTTRPWPSPLPSLTRSLWPRIMPRKPMRTHPLSQDRKQQSCMIAVADPTWIEERIGGSSRLTMALSRHGELATIVKSGGEAAEVDLIQSDCLLLAKARAVSILDTLHVAIARARAK